MNISAVYSFFLKIRNPPCCKISDCKNHQKNKQHGKKFGNCVDTTLCTQKHLIQLLSSQLLKHDLPGKVLQ